ncbi:MAG TPA: hypothetical protein VI819_03265 [Patescibacteria group bacterium]|nr:hypothetical protein [Patescibacteria group bacterium]
MITEIRPDTASIAYSSIIKSKNQAIVETASAISESHHETDHYNYMVKGGRLWSPTGKCFVEDITLDGPDRVLFQKLQDWGNNNSSGMSVWISPPLDSKHPFTKITTYEIWSGRILKMVKINSTLVDVDPVEIAKNLSMYSTDPLDYEFSENSLREKLLIMLDTKNASDLIDSYTKQNASFVKYKNFIQSSKSIYESHNEDPIRFAEMLEAQMGSFRLGCDTISLTKSGIKSLKIEGTLNQGGDKYGSLEFSCPHCGSTNTRPYNQLIRNCQHCGEDVSC